MGQRNQWKKVPYYNIQKNVSAHGVKRKNRTEKTMITRMRIGHTRQNKSFLIGKSGTDGCECGKTETVEHVLMEYERYTEERMRLVDKLQRTCVESGCILGTEGEGVSLTQKAVIEYLKLGWVISLL